MADFSLDDLIKKDKEQHKANRAPKVHHFPTQKAGQNKLAQRKKFQGGNDRDQAKPIHQRQQDDPRPFKKKFIKKNFDDNRNQPREVREQRPDKFKNRPPKQEKEETDNQEKQFRTLKVMGLNP
jgi:hypothetical protein